MARPKLDKTPLEVKMVPIGSLKPHPKNPRVHPDSALERLARSIKEFGWTNPILVSEDGFVLAGHARLKAAQKAGLTEVPVIYLPLKGKRAEAYMVADNRTAELTDWDFPRLKDLFEGLDTGDFDLTLTGFNLQEIEDLLTQYHLPETLWQGMPEFEQENLSGIRQIIVHFKTQEDVDSFAKLIGQVLTPKVRAIWHPQAPIEKFMDKRYVSKP